MPATPINFKNIPVQASIISRIIGINIESNNCFQELDDLISSDQGVASLLLRVVNSPFYNRGNAIATIPFAISLLGYSVVRTLALMAFSRSLFSHTKNEMFRLHIWQHSLLTAIASQSICQQMGEVGLKDDAFVAGLMHDTGKVLMFTHDPELYGKVFAYMFENDCSSVEAEQKFFGFDHCAVGLDAVQEWKLPVRFNDYMGKYAGLEKPEQTDDAVLISLRSANCLVKSWGLGANPLSDTEAVCSRLVACGLLPVLCERTLQEDYMQSLMDSDTYKICASL